jgi:hypothetical protein
MFSVFRRTRLRKFRLLAYVVSIVLVFSCICFDVLDVDDSDTPMNFIQINSQIVADAPRRSALDNFIDQLAVSWQCLLPEQTPPIDSSDLPDRGISMPSLLASCRTHGYRIALPRSAPPNDSVSVSL